MDCPVCKYPNPQGATHCGMCYEVFNRSAAQAYMHAVKRDRQLTEDPPPAKILSQRESVVERADALVKKIDWEKVAFLGRSWLKRSQKGLWIAVGLGLADPARLGILGLSYGGFMVNWLVGAAPDRFRAAVSENGVTNQLSGWANSDSGPEYDRMALLGDPLSEDGTGRLWRQSPLGNVTRIRTPLLMLQGEADLRCPAADNEQLFVALRHLGREVEYILYPESWHTFAITGRIDRRIDRNERVLAWFDRHLRG